MGNITKVRSKGITAKVLPFTVESQECQPVPSRDYIFPFAPVSTNSMYGVRPAKRGGGTIYLYPHCVDFKDEVAQLMRLQDHVCGRRLDTSPGRNYKVRMWFLYTREHYNEGQDLSNSVKLLEDGMFSYLQVDDAHVTEMRLTKHSVAKLPVPVRPYTEFNVPMLDGSILVRITCSDRSPLIDMASLGELEHLASLPSRAYGDPPRIGQGGGDVPVVVDSLNELDTWAKLAKTNRREAKQAVSAGYAARVQLMADLQDSGAIEKTWQDCQFLGPVEVEDVVRRTWHDMVGEKINHEDVDQSILRRWWSEPVVILYRLLRELTANHMSELGRMKRASVKAAKHAGGKLALVLGPSTGSWEQLLHAAGWKVVTLNPESYVSLCVERLQRCGGSYTQVADTEPFQFNRKYDAVFVPCADWYSDIKTIFRLVDSVTHEKSSVVLGGTWKANLGRRRHWYPWISERCGKKKLTPDNLRSLCKSEGLTEDKQFRFKKEHSLFLLHKE